VPTWVVGEVVQAADLGGERYAEGRVEVAT
jgi:hypothetical protein